MRRNIQLFIGIIASLIMAFTVNSTEALAVTFPQPTSEFYVYDGAEVLTSETEQAIVDANLLLESENDSPQIVVVTIESLEDLPIEEYANTLFNQWEIGSSGEDNGVLLLFSELDREIRIEIGYGMEGTINDAKAGSIIDKSINLLANNEYDLAIGAIFEATLLEALNAENSSSGSTSNPSHNESYNNHNENSRDTKTSISDIIFNLVFSVIFFGGLGVFAFLMVTFRKRKKKSIAFTNEYIKNNYPTLLNKLESDVSGYFKVYFTDNQYKYTLINKDTRVLHSEYSKKSLATIQKIATVDKMVEENEENYKKFFGKRAIGLVKEVDEYQEKLILQMEKDPRRPFYDILSESYDLKEIKEIDRKYLEHIREYVTKHYPNWHRAVALVSRTKPATNDEIESSMVEIQKQVHEMIPGIEREMVHIQTRSQNSGDTEILKRAEVESRRFNTDRITYALDVLVAGNTVESHFNKLTKEYAQSYVINALSSLPSRDKDTFYTSHAKYFVTWFIDGDMLLIQQSYRTYHRQKESERAAERRRNRSSGSSSSSSGGGSSGGGGRSGGGGASRSF